ncbi:putative UDP-rhamnose:rhamnosyltransferase 1 [Iris pallida]|uniref:UDP-rhamnose:rhamnosyltransferase 1 n=1 Tax=Iris pallida TaxID=29817 RepID=A0AAX6GTV8_IRIPA|nr:putative UDP-rhamnose:rhamnosyltransferase 1 [Iris pallida]
MAGGAGEEVGSIRCSRERGDGRRRAAAQAGPRPRGLRASFPVGVAEALQCDGGRGDAAAGVLEHTRVRGKVVVGWPPQLRILARPSVGGS